ncbi:hypothetical protein [Leifsonia sp. NPDC058230]|uniref:hypothetical protein n=1 Tax=Leifsonia sp. NPDC058230 TaxID=3346391 RepID=UPI0036DEEA21
MSGDIEVGRERLMSLFAGAPVSESTQEARVAIARHASDAFMFSGIPARELLSIYSRRRARMRDESPLARDIDVLLDALRGRLQSVVYLAAIEYDKRGFGIFVAEDIDQILAVHVADDRRYEPKLRGSFPRST